MPRSKKDINELFPPPPTSLGNNATAYSREIHHRATKPKVHRQIISRGIDEMWQADLAFMSGYKGLGKANENDGYTIVLVIIDVFSRFLWLIPLKDKTAAAMKEGFLKTLPRHPLAICTDEGAEFEGVFSAYLKDQNIIRFNIYGPHKAAMAERAIRTFQGYLWKLLTARQTTRWIDLLPLVAEYYNNTPHSALDGLTPTEASDPKNSERLWLHQYGQVEPNIPASPSFQVGDKVRVSVIRKAFDKSYYGMWSREAFEVIAVSMGHPVMYKIAHLDGKPLRGKYYEEDLLKTKFPTIELEKTLVEGVKPKDYITIERVIDAVTTRNNRQLLYEGLPMVYLKCKFEGLSEAANEALPWNKQWLPYVTFDFDQTGRPHPAIEALLRKKKLWTIAIENRTEWLKLKAREAQAEKVRERRKR